MNRRKHVNSEFIGWKVCNVVQFRLFGVIDVARRPAIIVWAYAWRLYQVYESVCVSC